MYSLIVKGTEYFMPIEIKSREFEFTFSESSAGSNLEVEDTPSDPDKLAADVKKIKALVAFKRPARAAPAVPRGPEKSGPVLKHIPLHDMEGFWWVSIILSIWREVQGGSYSDTRSKNEAAHFRAFANEAFESLIARRGIMTDNHTFRNAMSFLHPDLKVVGSELEKARVVLNKAFREAETDLTVIKPTVSDDVYYKFIRAYRAIALYLSREGDFDLAPLNATFLKKQEDPNPPLAGLSLDSRKAQLGKRRRADAHSEDALDTATNDADAALTASTSAKRLKHRDDDSVVSQSKQEDNRDRGPVIADASQSKDSATNVSGETPEEA